MAEGSEDLLSREVDSNDNQSSDRRRKSCWNHMKTFFKNITVEPALFMVLLGIGMENVFITNLWVDKICYFQFNYSSAICSHIQSGNYPEEQNNVQRMTNRYNIYTHILQYPPAVLVVLGLGTWGDVRGRRLPIIIPLLGFFLKSLSTALIAYWWFLPPNYLLMCYIPLACSGGLTGVYAGVYPYLSAVTSGRARTSRIAFVGCVIISAATIGQIVALFIFKRWGYVGVFGCQATLAATSILYSLVRLEDRPGDDESRGRSSSSSGEEEGIRQVLSFTRIKETLMVAFKKRAYGRRGDILGHLSIMILVVFIAGSYNYSFLYTRKKFSWDYKTFSIYAIIDTPVSAIGILVILPLLSYYWNVEDCILGFMGGVSIIFSHVIKATAPLPWVMYLASAVGLCMGQVTAASRGAVSKLVAKSELGAAFAVLAAGEAIIPIAAAATFTVLYNSTLDIFPGMIYILTAFLGVIICCIYVWVMTRRPSSCTQDDYCDDVRHLQQQEIAT